MAHAVVRLDNMQGTHDGTKLRSVRVDVATDNGTLVKLGTLEVGETNDVFMTTPIKETDTVDDLVLVATPEVMYDERLRNLSDFYNEANDIARGYILCKHDVFSVTEEAFNADYIPADPRGKASVDKIYLDPETSKFFAIGGNGRGDTDVSKGKIYVGKTLSVDVVGSLTYYAMVIE